MCVQFRETPLAFPLARQQFSDGMERLSYIPILGKRVERVGQRHVSANSQSFEFPIRAFAWDSNAVIGDHDRCLHLAPNARAAQQLTGYGDHTLVVIPGRHYWSNGDHNGRCHHTDGAFSLFCATCEGYGLEETTLPEFWRTEMPRGLVQALVDAGQQGAYVGQVIRRRSL